MSLLKNELIDYIKSGIAKEKNNKIGCEYELIPLRNDSYERIGYYDESGTKNLLLFFQESHLVAERSCNYLLYLMSAFTCRSRTLKCPRMVLSAFLMIQIWPALLLPVTFLPAASIPRDLSFFVGLTLKTST